MKLLKFIVAVVAIFGLIQLIPYGKDHKNPKVTKEVEWDSPKTKELFYRACGNCHSNKTKWPWYSNIAPISWLVMHDVQEGREHLNVSQWSKDYVKNGKKAAHEVIEGDMPPLIYKINHPEARLSKEEKDQLIIGLQKTFGH